MTINSSIQKKTFVILNPVAGTSDGEEVCNNLNQVLTEHQIPCHIYMTKKDDEIHKIAKEALDQGYQQFLAVGGDGTVSGVASALVHTHIPVIIIPTGTANALARVFGIPLDQERRINWWLSSESIKTLDAMHVAERYFLLNISAGTSSKALSHVSHEDKHLLGSLAYWFKGLQQILDISPYKYQVSIDGQMYTWRALEVVVANSGVVQFRPIRLDPDIAMDDGKISVCHIQPRNLFEYIRVVWEMLGGASQKKHEIICKEATKVVHIRADRRLPLQADGELIGYTPVSVELVPTAVNFLVPEKDKK